MRHETTKHQGGALKVALYARVSTKCQAQSLETQMQILRAEAELRGMEVVLEETEIASGVASKLPKRDALLEKSMQMGLDAIMVTRLDRFGRSQESMLNAWAALEKAGVNFISLAEDIDFSAHANKPSAIDFARMAEYERDWIKNRTREGREAAMLKGTKFGRPRTLSEDTEREITMGLRMNKTQMHLAKQYNVSQATIYRINKKINHQP
jgi:DNA invertase Pin-like site-specific DNA recombinase